MRQGTTDPIAWKHFLPQLIDFSIDTNKAGSIDNFGMAYTIMTAANFQERFGAAPQPRIHPGPAAGAAAALAQWKFDMDAFSQQGRGHETVRSVVTVTGIFPHLLKPLEIDRSLRTRTTEYIVSTIHAILSVFKKADFDWLRAELVKPYKVGSDIPQFLAMKLEHLTDLEEAGQPVNNMDAVALIKKLFPASSFNLCWQEYNKDVGIIAERTPANLCAYIIVYADQRMQHADEAPGLAFAAGHMAPPVPAASTDEEDLSNFFALYARDPAAAAAQLRKPTPARAAAAPAAAAVAKKKKPPHYCWTHGSNFTHESPGCNNKKLGHEDAATAKVSLGGKEPIT